jgi:general stress protein CsbA
MFVLGFPLLLLPFAVYNMIAFLTPGVGWTTPVATIHLMSGQDWVLTWGDLLIAFAALLLAVEILKSTRLGRRLIVDHVLAVALLAAMLAEFLLVRQAGTSTFFLLTVIGLVDVLIGFIVTIRSSRHKVEIERTA